MSGGPGGSRRGGPESGHGSGGGGWASDASDAPGTGGSGAGGRRRLDPRSLLAGLRRPSKPALGVGRPGEPIPATQRPTPVPSGSGRPSGPGLVGRPLPPAVAPFAAPDLGAVAAAGAGRELVLLVVILVGFSRLAEGPYLWAAAVLALGATILGSLEVLGGLADPDDAGVPVEALLVPGVATVAAIGGIRLVPLGLLLVPALAIAALLVGAALVVERRIMERTEGPGPSDRAALLSLVLLISIVAFSGIAAAIPGALAEPSSRSGGRSLPLPLEGLALLAIADGLVAMLLGYRLAALRAPSLAAALAAALSYAVIVAIGAAALRAMAIPRLLGPALLTLVLYLWSAYRSGPRGGRADARWIWELALLAALGAVVIAWNLLAQG